MTRPPICVRDFKQLDLEGASSISFVEHIAVHPHIPTMSTSQSLQRVQALYKATHASASRFASYNFHNYFVRRTDETFRPAIQSLESDPKSMTPEAVTRFLEERGQELEVLKRSAEVNRLYEGPKLVVEHATPITGGGGAGAEAAAGGGGQPI